MNVLVIGAGIIGLATGRAMAARGHEVVVVDSASSFGTGISSRSSEVVHGGMYYPLDSLKQRHCVAGRRRLYSYCESRSIPHRRCGKLIVATTPAEADQIEIILARGIANGVEGLELISGASATELEPALRCISAILSPETGIIDSHALMLAFLADIQSMGGCLVLRTPVERLVPSKEGWTVKLGGSNPDIVPVDAVVNCAGFGARSLALSTVGYPVERVPRQVLAKGNYFACIGRQPFARLIYPAPVEGGLGIHATLDLAGRVRFGPDVEWVEDLDFTVSIEREAAFYEAIRSYWPDLPDGALAPDYAGIRPKLSGPGQVAFDFVIDGPDQHGLPRLVHMFGLESPGLTASMSVAEAVASMIGP